MKTVVGMFNDVNEAQRSLEDLMKFGIGANDISVVTKRLGAKSGNGLNLSSVDAKDTGPLAARGPLATMLTRDRGDLQGSLRAAGVSPALAEHYVEAVRDGETLEFVLVEDNSADQVVEIMRRHAARYGATDETNGTGTEVVGQSANEKVKAAGAGILATAAGGLAAAKAAISNPTSPKEAVTERLATTGKELGSTAKYRDEQDLLNEKAVKDEDRFIPILREEIHVGKREVERGAVHVDVHVTERPISEHITLREEHVEIERRATDRPPRPDELEFRTGGVDMIEHGEEVVVSKQVRVVEEVLIHKRVTEHEETVNDKLRSTEIDIDKRAGDRSAYASHFASLNTGMPFDDARPAYEFGSKLRRAKTDQWTDIEPNARDSWEAKRPGTWAKFRDAIYYAWSRARST
jgi:stress response protein YsnF